MTPRWVIQMIAELPDTSDTVASIRASAPPPAGDTPTAARLRTRRDWRGWGIDRIIAVRTSNVMGDPEHPFPTPWDDQPGGGSRPEATFEDIGL